MSALQWRQCGAIEIAFRQIGKGPPLLMFHGAEGDHQIYDRLQEELAEKVTSISFDQRDCGATRSTESAPYTLTAIVDDAVALLDALGYDRVHVLGNSIGGVLAQTMALRWPGRVDHLILGLTWPADEQLQDLNPSGLARRTEYAAMGPAGERDMIELMAGSGYLDQHPEFVQELRSLSTVRPAEDRARRFAALVQDPLADPAAILHPTLVIGGERDQMVPPELSRRLADRIPNATFELVEGVGHLAARQSPDRLARVIGRFLNG